jgi:hypothetical protein
MGSWSNRKTSAPHAEDLGAIPSESTLMNSPVVQWQRLLSYKQETMVQLHPGLLTNAQVRQLAERLGLNPRDSRFDSSSGHIRLGRQLADHLGLEPGMLWVRIPPELLQVNNFVLVEQPGVLACLSRRRSWVQIPSGTLDSTVRKPAKRRSSNLRDFVGSTPTRATDWVVFLVAACKTVVTKQARWTTRGSIPSRPTDNGPFV